MSVLTQQQKDARERIIVMALMSGLDEKDLCAIGYKLKKQKERAAEEALSARYHEIEVLKHEGDLIEVQYNGMTVTAVQNDSQKNSRWSTDRDKFTVTVRGPKGGVKYNRVLQLRDWQIDRWPLKLMVKRSPQVTALAGMLVNQIIPTK